MTDRELAATILMLGAESKDLKGKEAKELLTQVEQEISKHVESKLKNGVLHSVIYFADSIGLRYTLIQCNGLSLNNNPFWSDKQITSCQSETLGIERY